MRKLFTKLQGFILSLFFVLFSAKAFGQKSVADGAGEESMEAKTLKEVATEQMDTLKQLIDTVIEFAVKYSFQVLGGIIVLIVGWIVTGFVARFVNKLLVKYKVDVTVSKFIIGAVRLIIMSFVVIVAMGKFGIEIAPLIAGISVAGFGLSFALQGPLSNYAAGAVLIFTKPFTIGEIIEVAGVNGEVTDMKLSRTEVKTIDGNMIVIPNKHIIGEIIHNYKKLKRLDINVGVSYGSDMDKVIKVVEKVVNDDMRVVSPMTKVGISEFADSGVNIYARLWCKQDEYWNLLFDLNKTIFAEFNKNGIVIPFPQRDVHMIKEG